MHVPLLEKRRQLIVAFLGLRVRERESEQGGSGNGRVPEIDGLTAAHNDRKWSNSNSTAEYTNNGHGCYGQL